MQKYKPGDNPALDAQLQSADIHASEFDKSKGTSLQRVWIKGQLHTFNPRAGTVEPVYQDGQIITDPTKIPVEEGGLWVTPGAALGARAAAENRDFQRGRDENGDVVTDTNKTNDREAENAQTEAKAKAAEAAADDLEAQAREVESGSGMAEKSTTLSGAIASVAQENKGRRAAAAELRRRAAAKRRDAGVIRAGVKPPITPRSASAVTPSGGKYTGQRISRSKLSAAAQRLGKTVSETESYLKSQGAIIY
jgi:hypothetical protein